MKNSSSCLSFSKAAIHGIVTVVGDQVVSIEEDAERLGLSSGELEKLRSVIGLHQRRIVSDNSTTVDLCVQAAQHLLSGLCLEPKSIQAIIFVSQSPDYSAPASAAIIQDRLAVDTKSMCFDIRLGCSGFVYGLANAYSLIECGFETVLLCVGDVASKFTDPADASLAPIMGDAGSAIMIKRSQSKSFFQFFTDGSGARSLYIPNSGVAHNPMDVGIKPYMKMNGAEIFNFTLKHVPDLIFSTLNLAGFSISDIDKFILHQPNQYILNYISKKIKVDKLKLPIDTQSKFGNQNSASIPGTINGFVSEDYSKKYIRSLFAGFGIGLSWAGAIIETQKIFSPPSFVWEGL